MQLDGQGSPPEARNGQMSVCTCGNLKRPESPFTQYGSRYDLKISDEFIIRDAKCLFCGGNELRIDEKGPPPVCMCGKVESHLNTEVISPDAKKSIFPRRPKGFHRRPDGLFMLNVGRLDFAVWFCPFCGGRMKDGLKAGWGT